MQETYGGATWRVWLVEKHPAGQVRGLTGYLAKSVAVHTAYHIALGLFYATAAALPGEAPDV